MYHGYLSAARAGNANGAWDSGRSSARSQSRGERVLDGDGGSAVGLTVAIGPPGKSTAPRAGLDVLVVTQSHDPGTRLSAQQEKTHCAGDGLTVDRTRSALHARHPRVGPPSRSGSPNHDDSERLPYTHRGQLASSASTGVGPLTLDTEEPCRTRRRRRISHACACKRGPAPRRPAKVTARAGQTAGGIRRAILAVDGRPDSI